MIKMYNERLTISIVLIFIFIILSGLLVWQLSSNQEESEQESIQALLELARNSSSVVNTIEFDEAKISSNYDAADFKVSAKLFDKLNRYKRPKFNYDNEFNSESPVYAEITIVGFAVKEVSSNKNAAHLKITTNFKNATLFNEIIEVNKANLVFYETISNSSSPGNYNITISVKDVITNMEIKENLVFTLK